MPNLQKPGWEQDPHDINEQVTLTDGRIMPIMLDRLRILVTMAIGAGKTMVAFQVCWRLWNSRCNRTGEHRRPRIVYLADRNILAAEYGVAQFSTPDILKVTLNRDHQWLAPVPRPNLP